MTQCSVCEQEGADRKKFGEYFHKKCYRKLLRKAKKSKYGDVGSFIKKEMGK